MGWSFENYIDYPELPRLTSVLLWQMFIVLLIVWTFISRSNMTLTPHPDKDELIMFGGEFLTGSKVKSSKWKLRCTCTPHDFVMYN